MNNVAYVGHGVEIEDDVLRLRRRKLEFDGDASRGADPGEPRPLRLKGFLTAVLSGPKDR